MNCSPGLGSRSVENRAQDAFTRAYVIRIRLSEYRELGERSSDMSVASDAILVARAAEIRGYTLTESRFFLVIRGGSVPFPHSPKPLSPPHWGRGGRTVRQLASHQGETGSITGRFTPRIFACGNRLGRCRRSAGFFPRRPFQPCVPTLLHAHFASPSSALRTTMLSAQATPLTAPVVERYLQPASRVRGVHAGLSILIFADGNPTTEYTTRLACPTSHDDSSLFSLNKEEISTLLLSTTVSAIESYIWDVGQQIALIICAVQSRIQVSNSSAGMQGLRKREIPEKTRRPEASSSTIPTCENQGVTRLGIEPGSLWWKASSLTAQPQQPRFSGEPIIHSHQFTRDSTIPSSIVSDWLGLMQNVSNKACPEAKRNKILTSRLDYSPPLPPPPPPTPRRTWFDSRQGRSRIFACGKSVGRRQRIPALLHTHLVSLSFGSREHDALISPSSTRCPTVFAEVAPSTTGPLSATTKLGAQLNTGSTAAERYTNEFSGDKSFPYLRRRPRARPVINKPRGSGRVNGRPPARSPFPSFKSPAFLLRYHFWPSVRACCPSRRTGRNTEAKQ
ncbi:hypothetical protein PR048_032263, partial [Dryococelus australis]